MKRKQKTENKPTLVAVLIDRSGSMASCKDDTIGGYNSYVEKLKSENPKGMIFTITQFDSQSVDVLQNGVPISKAMTLDGKSYEPRGGTPLYDAIGKTIRAAENQAGDKYKVIFMVLTDGQENSSHEWQLDGVKALIKEKEDKHHWTFTYVGIGVDAWAGLRTFTHGTVGALNVMNFSDKKDISKVMRRAGGQSVSYACSVQGVSASVTDYWKGSGLKSEDES